MTPLVLRYRTNLVTCLREWFWIPNTHAAEHVTRIVGPCARTLALAAPLLGPVLPAVPMVGVGVPYPQFRGTSWRDTDFPQGSVPAASNGWGTYVGLSAGSSQNHPASLTGSAHEYSGPAWANRVPQENLPVRLGLPLAGVGAGTPGVPATSFREDTTFAPQLPAIPAGDIPARENVPDGVATEVPEPTSWALLAIGLVCVAVGMLDRSGRR